MNEQSRNSFLKAEKERRQKAKAFAREYGFEVLTPLGAQKLFGKSQPAFTKAVREGRLPVAFSLEVTGKGVSMVLLQDAIKCWGPADDTLLEQMRENGSILDSYNVLHPEPVRDLGEWLE